MDRRLLLSRAVALAALAWGLASAARRAWLCDDAFISFRYAWNLVRGNGLVFNPGERVEGYTNFLWTLWCAIPLALGADVEPFAIGSGLVLFAVLLGLLYREHLTAGLPGVLPLALVGAAVSPDLAIFATCGLETCLVAVLALAGYAALASRRRALAGVLFGVATLARPDAALFVVAGGLFALWEDGERPGVRFLSLERFRGALALGASAAAFVVPHLVFRYLYYGDLVPNTYYAKSANLSWWSQGLTYVALVFARYWPLLVGPLLLPIVWWRTRQRPLDAASQGDLRRLALASALALPYVVYVAKVGGDFMFARLLVPVMPLLLVALERALVVVVRVAVRERGPAEDAVRRENRMSGAAATFAALALAFTPATVGTDLGGHGIVDEWRFYHVTRPDWAASSRRDGAILARYFEGLPVRVAFFGAQARLMYDARTPVAIESAAGLTDAFIAKQTLAQRGRVGHEKAAPASYLLETRRVHLTFDPLAGRIAGLDGLIPHIPIDLDGVRGRVVTWDPALMAELGRRGARFPDVPRLLDAYITRIPTVPCARARNEVAQFERFYVLPARDTARGEALARALEGCRVEGGAR